MQLLSGIPSTRAPQQIIAHHGCSRRVANRIIAGESFMPSTNIYDWLGFGIYFWEYGPHRAFEWAQLYNPKPVAVIEATITLGCCLNLLDTEHFIGMQHSYSVTRVGLQEAGLPVPENAYPLHHLDCLIVDGYCLDYSMSVDMEIQTVRGCFPEGEPLFPDSKILSQTHAQIAVRDASCISNLKMLTFS